MPNEDWPRLAHALDARIAELHLTQAGIQAKGGPSPAKVREIINGRSTTLSPSKRRDLERAIGWAPGSIDRILAGGEPTLLSDEASVFLSRIRHPYQAALISDAIENDDKGLVAALEEVLETGHVSPNAHAQLQRLRDDATIKQFPKIYELLSRGGKLKVAKYGQGVRLEELQQSRGGSDGVETTAQPDAPTTVDEDEEVVRLAHHPPQSSDGSRRGAPADESPAARTRRRLRRQPSEERQH